MFGNGRSIADGPIRETDFEGFVVEAVQGPASVCDEAHTTLNILELFHPILAWRDIVDCLLGYNRAMSGISSTRVRKPYRMATIVPARPTEDTAVVAAKPIHGAPSSSASVVMHVVAARDQIRMGKKATIPFGVNWITLVAMSLFHVGALAAFFFFSWQRLAVAAILYILAINVGIGMCYHRPPARAWRTPS